jgi:hypothetical protein
MDINADDFCVQWKAIPVRTLNTETDAHKVAG